MMCRFGSYTGHGDEMKQHIKYYLLYAFFYLFGAFFSAGLLFAYELRLPNGLTEFSSLSRTFSHYVRLTARFLGPEVLLFLSGLTIYACALGAVISLCHGILFGQLVMSYCLSRLNPFTHAASLAFLLAFGVLITLTTTYAALYRSTLTAVAPEPKQLIRLPHTQAYFYSFLTIAAVTMAVSAALYFFLVYFPI